MMGGWAPNETLLGPAATKTRQAVDDGRGPPARDDHRKGAVPLLFHSKSARSLETAPVRQSRAIGLLDGSRAALHGSESRGCKLFPHADPVFADGEPHLNRPSEQSSIQASQTGAPDDSPA